MAENRLTVYEKTDPLDFADKMGLAIATLIGCDPNQGKAMALQAYVEGISPMQLQRRYHWIQGKPSMKADAMRAEFRMNHGGDFEIVESTGDAAEIHFTDSKGRKLPSRITWAEAQQEPWPWKKDCGPGTPNTEPTIKNLKDNWSTPLQRANMLMARATSTALRRLCPELVAGVYTPEEMMDTERTERPVVVEQKASASQIIAAAAHSVPTLATPVPTGPAPVDVADGNVEDAQYEMKIDPNAPGSVSAQRVSALDKAGTEYFGEGWPAKRDQALADRNCSVLQNLSDNQAGDLLVKIDGLIRDRKAAEKN